MFNNLSQRQSVFNAVEEAVTSLKSFNDKTFSVLHLNVRSLNRNFESLRGHSKMTSRGKWGEGGPKTNDKKWQVGGRYMQIVISPPKQICISFQFSLVFGERGSTQTLVSNPVKVSFQALAWLWAHRLNKSWSSHS